MNDLPAVPSAQVALETNPLDTVYAARRANLRLLVAQHGNGALAARLGYTSGSYITQLLSDERSFTEVAARSIEQKLGLMFGWMDMTRAA